MIYTRAFTDFTNILSIFHTETGIPAHTHGTNRLGSRWCTFSLYLWSFRMRSDYGQQCMQRLGWFWDERVCYFVRHIQLVEVNDCKFANEHGNCMNCGTRGRSHRFVQSAYREILCMRNQQLHLRCGSSVGLLCVNRESLNNILGFTTIEHSEPAEWCTLHSIHGMTGIQWFPHKLTANVFSAPQKHMHTHALVGRTRAKNNKQNFN